MNIVLTSWVCFKTFSWYCIDESTIVGQQPLLMFAFNKIFVITSLYIVNNYWWMNHIFSWPWFKWPTFVRRHPIKKITFIYSLLIFLGPITERCSWVYLYLDGKSFYVIPQWFRQKDPIVIRIIHVWWVFDHFYSKLLS